MVAQRAKGTPIPDPFELDELTLAWLEKRHPTVDPELAAERFSFWASEYMYANWMKTFQNFITREADNNKLGPMLKKVKPKSAWDDLLADAQRLGFRRPNEGELLTDYRAQLEALKKPRSIDFGSSLKAMTK